jgi:hypothetical protein
MEKIQRIKKGERNKIGFGYKQLQYWSLHYMYALVSAFVTNNGCISSEDNPDDGEKDSLRYV